MKQLTANKQRHIRSASHSRQKNKYHKNQSIKMLQGSKTPIIETNKFVGSFELPTLDKNIQSRLERIKKGFQALESNLSLGEQSQRACKLDQELLTKTSPVTARKPAKRLFDSEKKIKCRRKRENKPKCDQIKYHNCIYEESLLSLMRIVTIQKQEIMRLNNKISREKLS